ncbi:MAG: hypothetical protein RL346_42 [Verrucomicrobiota bacterium]
MRTSEIRGLLLGPEGRDESDFGKEFFAGFLGGGRGFGMEKHESESRSGKIEAFRVRKTRFPRGFVGKGGRSRRISQLPKVARRFFG